MSQLLSSEWFVVPALGILIFIISYLWSDRVIAFLHRRSLGQREEVVRLLDLMFVEADHRRITLIMLLVSFGLGLLMFIILWPNYLAGLILGAAVTVAGWSVPKTVATALYNKRCNQVIDQMVDGMTIMANGIKSGLSVTQSMERVVENLKNPISQEFALVLSKIRLGRTVEDGLNELSERVPRPDMQMFVLAVTILKETGGNMAETFETINETIRERQKIQKKIEALTSQGIAQGVIVTLVPFFLMFVFMIIDPNYIRPLFTTTLGIILLLVMIGLQIIGGLMIRKIVKIEV
jgi:tight adherence protein B